MKLGEMPFDGAYNVYMNYKGKWNKVHAGCGECPDEFKQCKVLRLYPCDDLIIVEVAPPDDPRCMYVVETDSGAVKHFTRLQYARRAAAKAANDGKVYLDNPELSASERWLPVRSVRVYDMRCPDDDIDF